MLVKEKKVWTPDNSFLLEYKAKAESGDIILGRDLWQELKNLEEDISDERFQYDVERAMLRIKFIEKCCRLTKSPYYGKPMNLMLWQKALIEAAYSFKMVSIDTKEWIDRFQEILLIIARKNGKTETIAALELAEMILGDSGSDIICSGMDDGTSDLSYQTVDTMRMLIDPKPRDTWRNQKGIKCLANNNHVYKLSDSTRQKEGRNIDFAGIDEVWSLTDDGIYEPIKRSTSTKPNCKIFLFGSEGYVDDGFLDKKRKEYEKIIYKEDDKDSALRKLPWLYTMDSEAEIWETNEDGISRAWEKANPGLGTIKLYSYLRDRVDEARETKSARIETTCKDFNIKQKSVVSWLELPQYEYECKYSLEDFAGCFYIGGLDLAETSDLCSARILMMKPGDSRKYIYQQYFIPESKLDKDNDDHNAGAKYKEWVKDGYITIAGDTEVNMEVISEWFYSLYAKYKLKLFKVGYDQKFALDWIKSMEDPYGWTKRGEDADLILIQQNAQTLSAAISLCETEFSKHLIYYNNNPVDRWCLSNAGLKVDRNGSLIIKKEKEKRIDGAVTYPILFETLRRYRSDFNKLIRNGGNE
ncbi:MAG: terminase large subunit [Clostridiales bacterium]|nr:terminase large subunit [Clostridiales bacterium]